MKKAIEKKTLDALLYPCFPRVIVLTLLNML